MESSKNIIEYEEWEKRAIPARQAKELLAKYPDAALVVVVVGGTVTLAEHNFISQGAPMLIYDMAWRYKSGQEGVKPQIELDQAGRLLRKLWNESALVEIRFSKPDPDLALRAEILQTEADMHRGLMNEFRNFSGEWPLSSKVTPPYQAQTLTLPPHD